MYKCQECWPGLVIPALGRQTQASVWGSIAAGLTNEVRSRAESDTVSKDKGRGCYIIGSGLRVVIYVTKDPGSVPSIRTSSLISTLLISIQG